MARTAATRCEEGAAAGDVAAGVAGGRAGVDAGGRGAGGVVAGAAAGSFGVLDAAATAAASFAASFAAMRSSSWRSLLPLSSFWAVSRASWASIASMRDRRSETGVVAGAPAAGVRVAPGVACGATVPAAPVCRLRSRTSASSRRSRVSALSCAIAGPAVTARARTRATIGRDLPRRIFIIAIPSRPTNCLL